MEEHGVEFLLAYVGHQNRPNLTCSLQSAAHSGFPIDGLDRWSWAFP